MSKKHYIIPIFVPHEGCPHNCVFCNQDKITGIDSEVVDEAFVEKTINEYIETINTNEATIEVSFYGGTFTAIPIDRQKRLLSVAKKYKEKGKVQYIHMSTRPDYIDDNILEVLRQYSVDIIELGVQSLDEDVLMKSGRGHTIEQVENASKLIKDYGFTLGHQLMVGLPGDNFIKDIKSVLKSIKMSPDIARIYPSLVIKDTPMEKMLNDKVYNPYTLEEAIEISKVMYSMYVLNNVNVIRIGLQPTEEINEKGDIIKGPFHPAFKELVESKMINEMIVDYIKNLDEEEIKIVINNKDISKLYANKKTYFNDILKNKISKNIKIVQSCDINRGTFNIVTSKENKVLTLKEYMIKLSKRAEQLINML